MSLVEFYNEMTEVDNQMAKEAEEINKLAAEEEAAGRILARGFIDELNKMAQQREEAGPTWTKILGKKYTQQGPRREIVQKEMAARGRKYGPQQKYVKQEQQFERALKEQKATEAQRAKELAAKRGVARSALGRLGNLASAGQVQRAVAAHEAKRKSPAYAAKRTLGLARSAAKETYGPALRHGKMMGEAVKETGKGYLKGAKKAITSARRIGMPAAKTISTPD